MAAHQGRKRLAIGVRRALTQHELIRGYVFVSKDKDLNEVLNTSSFILKLGEKSFPNRRIDVSGRVHVLRTELSAFSDGYVSIRIVSQDVLSISKSS